MSKANGPTVTTAKLSEQELAAIATAMQRHGGVERRQHSRLPLSQEFPLVVRLGGGEESPYLNVTPRDISSSGLGFFHVAYVHPGTAVQMIMKNRASDAVCIKGVVARCRHVSGRLHEVGVTFDTAIQVEVFVNAPSGAAIPSSMATPAEVYKRVTAVSDQLKALAARSASFDSILERVGELAVLLAPFDAGHLERLVPRPEPEAGNAAHAASEPRSKPNAAAKGKPGTHKQ